MNSLFSRNFLIKTLKFPETLCTICRFGAQPHLVFFVFPYETSLSGHTHQQMRQRFWCCQSYLVIFKLCFHLIKFLWDCLRYWGLLYLLLHLLILLWWCEHWDLSWIKFLSYTNYISICKKKTQFGKVWTI